MEKIYGILCAGLFVSFVFAGTANADVYYYSYAADFGGNLNEDQFEQEIESDPIIVTPLVGVLRDFDDVSVHFDSALSGPELASLNSLVASHYPAAVPEPSPFVVIGLLGLVGVHHRRKKRSGVRLQHDKKKCYEALGQYEKFSNYPQEYNSYRIQELKALQKK